MNVVCEERGHHWLRERQTEHLSSMPMVVCSRCGAVGWLAEEDRDARTDR